VLQALPNIIWALFPPSVNSLDGNASSVLVIEYGEHILGVAIVIMLLFLLRCGQDKTLPKGMTAIAAYAAIGLYWICWILYFYAVQPLPIIYAMVVLPPIAFFFAEAAKRVYPISEVSAVFLVFHLLVTLENFPVGV